MTTDKSSLADTLSKFTDRLFLAGGTDPGDDALAIPAERLAVYHELVRRNYRAMLRFAYTMSFRLMVADLKRVGGQDGLPADIHEIVRGFLSAGAARTHSTREIADTFRTWFDEECAALHELRPELSELMTVERAALAASYAWDDPGTPATVEALASLSAAPVAEFLATHVVRAPSSTLLSCDHAAGTLYHALSHRRFPDADDHSPGPQFVLVSREPDTLEPEVTVIDEATFLALGHAPPGEPIEVELLAGMWIDELPAPLADANDTDKLQAFAAAVFTGLRSGALMLAR